MPKINVYLPDDLAEAVKEAGVPVSAVCQRALEQAVRRVTAIRETVLGEVDFQEPSGALARFTPRLRQVLTLAVEQARAAGAPKVGTEHLLGGLLAEGTNLALHVLRAMEIAPERVARDLAGRQPTPQEPGEPDEPRESGDTGPRRFDAHAASALELAVSEATSLGHNYLGGEHLLLGLAAEPDGVAGQVLRGLGADPRLVRRAVTAALAGYVHLRAQTQEQNRPSPEAMRQELAAAVRQEIQPLAGRITRLEEHLGLAAGD